VLVTRGDDPTKSGLAPGYHISRRWRCADLRTVDALRWLPRARRRKAQALAGGDKRHAGRGEFQHGLCERKNVRPLCGGPKETNDRLAKHLINVHVRQNSPPYNYGYDHQTIESIINGNGLVVLFIGPPPTSQFVSRPGCALGWWCTSCRNLY